MLKTIKASLILAGMIIGVGMFGIPFSFASSGFWLGALELVFLSAVVTSLHLLYGEIVLKTDGFHRLPGYIKIVVGKKSSALAWFSAVFGISGSLLAYLLVGSIFLSNIISGFGVKSERLIWIVFLSAAVAAITYFPLKKESFINAILTIFLIIFAFFLTFFLLPKVDLVNLKGFNARNIFMPYGVLLFALSGGIVIPDIITITGREKRRARSAIIIGTLLPAILYLFFAAAVIGISGGNVSEETLAGLKSVAGGKIFILGSIVGFLAVITSFIAAGKNFQEMLRLDVKMPRLAAWFIVSLLPISLYAAGLQNFISVISAVGAIGIGVDSGLIIAANRKLRRNESMRTSVFSCVWKAAICIIISLGVFYELYKII